jgi:hypothetical protein
MQLRVLERVGRIRWIFLPVGMCALTAVGAHAAADVVGDRVLWCVDRVDAFFDAIFASWSVTAPLVDLVGLSQRTFFARAVALIWELVADALIAVPLLGYQERDPAVELQAARILLRKKPTPQRLVRPLATLLVAVAGACAVARMVQGSVQLALHASWLSHLLAIGTLLALLLLLVPRAAFRALEHADAKGRAISVGVFGTVVLLPLMLAALFASQLLAFFR